MFNIATVKRNYRAARFVVNGELISVRMILLAQLEATHASVRAARRSTAQFLLHCNVNGFCFAMMVPVAAFTTTGPLSRKVAALALRESHKLRPRQVVEPLVAATQLCGQIKHTGRNRLIARLK